MSAETGDQQQVSKGLLITLGVVAAIGAAAALWVFVLQPLSADDVDTVAVDDEADATEPESQPAPDAQPSPAPDGEPDDPGEDADPEDGEDADPEDGEDADEAEDDALETTQVVNARDPFTQLVTDTSGDGGTGGAATSGGSANGGSASSGGTATGGSGGDGDSGDGDGDDRAEVDSTTVTLVTIYTGDDGLQRAAVEVDEAGYDVLEGDTFAGNFQLLDIADECATMLYGDSRFTLCEGDRIRK